ncbi:MAG: NADH-quinone oxidoreductase subunit N [Candidatus Lutacidiplasmatales archaeon]
MGPVPWQFLPEVVLLGGALLIFLLDALDLGRTELLGGIAVATSALSLLLVVADLGFAPLAFARSLPAGSLDAGADPALLYAFSSLGLIFQGIFLSSAFLVALASISRPSREKGAAIFFGLLLLATLGMMLAALAADLIFLLIAVEVTGISSYVMVGYLRKDPRGMEAAMKFFIIGALSTALSFFGASLLFGAFGSTSFPVLSDRGLTLGLPALALLGYGLVIAGLAFKVTLVPFHMWAVDVYDGAPTDVSAFLAGGTKKLGIFAFLLVFIGPVALFASRGGAVCAGASSCLPAYNLGPTLQLTLGIMAVLTMTIGNVLALLQKEMKRMLAYSSISQAGYMMIGIAIGSAPAVAGATFQVLAHVFMKAGAFLVVAGVAGIGVGPLISDWKGLGNRRPMTSVAFALMLLSLAGIPLTVGFVSKFVLFSAAVYAQGPFIYLAIAGLLNSALSVFYYARVLKVVFMDGQDPPNAVPEPASVLPAGGLGYGRAGAIAIACVAIVALGVYPQPVLSAIQAAAQHFVLTGA